MDLSSQNQLGPIEGQAYCLSTFIYLVFLKRGSPSDIYIHFQGNKKYIRYTYFSLIANFAVTIFPHFSSSVNLTATFNRIKAEKASLVPLPLSPDIEVDCVPICSQVDQKAENALTENDNSSACPKVGCQLPMKDFQNTPPDPLTGLPYDPDRVTADDLFTLIFSLLHFDLNLIKALIRLACLIHMNLFIIGGNSHEIIKDFKVYYDNKYREIQEAYQARGIYIGRVRSNQAGTTDTGLEILLVFLKSFKIVLIRISHIY